MHQLTNKKNKVLIYLIFLIILSTTNNKSLNTQKNYSATINKISVSGLSNKQNLQITNKINKLLIRNIFFINEEDIDNIISEYNLVEKYSAKKIYPNQISIEIEPTKFIAKIKGNNEFLVGSNGKLISNTNTDKSLPILFGIFNSKKFLKFEKEVQNSNFKFSDFKSIFFYPSNRWDILTINDILIKLPEKNLDRALKMAYKIINNHQFNNNMVIDLRISNHIIVK